MNRPGRFHPGLAALLEVMLLFLPSIPAYVWVWPNLAGTDLEIANLVTHLYVLAGALFIGLRRWSPDQLGLNRRGLWLSLASGSAVILGRSLVIISVNWGLPPQPASPARLLGEALYYFGVVGFVQELLFRGLVYRACEDWLGARWAIWGSSIGFVLWHVFGGGPLIGAAMLVYGLFFGLMRWRAGGILGAILIHGAMDFLGARMLPDLDVLSLGRPEIPWPVGLWIGLALIVLAPVALWKYDRLVVLINSRYHPKS